jgi:hypothetical protein
MMEKSAKSMRASAGLAKEFGYGKYGHEDG